ncbi:MAG: hypothetical protein D4S01_01110 [Dehalococcoidia bacterium]|nr:MAG: hypothetical protein D4S01_01110 [Dehalococcoidia bacterium]
MKFNGAVWPLLLLFFSIINISCAPTYPKEKIIEGVKSLCEKEYNVAVEVAIEESTMGVRMPIEGLFDAETFQINTKSFDKITGVMLSASRVALSSDKSIDFYTVIAHDKKVPGAEVVMTRYVHDLRRFFLGDISRGEFTKRMVFDVRFNPQGIIDTWLGSFTFKQYSLADFMITQIQRRITDEFRENNDLVGKFKVMSCTGAFDNGILSFVVDISREGLPMSELIHGKSWRDKVLELCMQKITYVAYIYSFEEAANIQVINKFDDNRIKISKNEINQWRKRRIRID